MKAVLKNGVICPQEPLPKDWREGTELHVERLPGNGQQSGDELDQWMARVQASADQMDPEDEKILAESIRAIREHARELARKEPTANGVNPTDAWMDEVEAIAAQGNPEDDLRLDAAIQAIRQQQKELARKKLGLEP